MQRRFDFTEVRATFAISASCIENSRTRRPSESRISFAFLEFTTPFSFSFTMRVFGMLIPKSMGIVPSFFQKGAGKEGEVPLRIWVVFAARRKGSLKPRAAVVRE